MEYFSIPIEVKTKVQVFQFHLGQSFHVWSGGLELIVDKDMKIIHCEMPDEWVDSVMDKLRLLIKVNKI